MNKPSIFSNDYKKRVKKRKLNTFLFVLLIISITFFGGKYYLDRHNVSFISNIQNSKIVKSIHLPNWWSKSKDKSSSKSSNTVKPKNEDKELPTKVITTTQDAVTAGAIEASQAAAASNDVYEYSYKAKDKNSYSVEYTKLNSLIQITGLKEITGTSEYSISKDKSMIVFDIKDENSIITCDSLGNFKVISKPFYKTHSTNRIITKEAATSRYKNFVWAQKPYFTMDGRVIYVSRLPYIRADSTIYLWSVNVDGSNHKKISELNRDISEVKYIGYDVKEGVKLTVAGTQYNLAKGSYMLKK